MAEEETWEILAKRLAALVAKIDARDTQMMERLEQHEAHMERLDTMLAEQRAFNQEQIRINTRLETLMTWVFQERHNGHED